MRRASACFAIACIWSCGDAPRPLAAPDAIHRDCAAPLAPSCTQLVVVTPREPISRSDSPPQQSQMLFKDDGVYAFEYPALLQRFEFQGLPPRLHATSNVLLDPPPSVTPLLTDGVDLFGMELQQDGDDRSVQVQFWNASNKLITNTSLPLTAAWGSASFAAYQGLAIVRLESLSIIDTTGAILWMLPGDALDIPTLGAYGCGFIGESGNYDAGVLTTIPLDGRASLTQPSPPAAFNAYNSGPFAWPYDPRGVLFITQPIPTDPHFDPSAGCTTSIDVLFDDGRPPIHREHHTACGVAMGALSSSLGAVVFIGDQLGLLDASATLLGDWLPTQGATFVNSGNYIAALGSMWSPDTLTTTYYETVVGCGP